MSLSISDQVVPAIPYVPSGTPALSLTLLSGPGSGRVIPCRRAVTLIGSRAGCKLSLRHPHVAPVHLAIVNAGPDIWIRDLASPHGSTLNNLPLEHERAEDGHVFAVGPWEFRIDVEPTNRPENADLHALSLEPSPEMIVLEHIATGRLLVPRREVSVIGRRPGCDIAISDAHVSRCHALLLRYMGHPAVCDLLTSAPVRVNTAPIGFRVLVDGDLLAIGGTEFRVRVRESKIGRNGSNGRGIAASDRTNAGAAAFDEQREAPLDLIDIRAAESNKRWVVADHVEEIQRNS